MTLKTAYFGHREIDENAINAGQRVDQTITPLILTCKVKLSELDRAEEGGEEGGGAASIVMAARAEPSLV